MTLLHSERAGRTELLSRFTPSMMPAETLEGVFVGREQLLATIMRRVGEAATSEARNQTLLVGPRGAGKTHLIALTYHRTQALIAGGARLQLSWLPEDPWTIVSYRHLLAAIAERLEGEPPLYSRGSVAELEAWLTARADEHGTIVVLVENLDRILHQLGEPGQASLRHFLQHGCKMLLIATSTTLDRSLVNQAFPFFDFFTTTRLRPFTPEQGRDMLVAIAERSGDQELVDFLRSERGLGRIKAIAHLAGGQPRLWSLLSSSLTVHDLDSLVDLLLTRFDDLTPYYQEQVAAISPQQRLIVAELAEANHPLYVGALAERLEIDERSAAKAVKDLVDRGWISPVNTVFAKYLDRRRTYYELAEPLARLSFQIKEARGKPLRLVVDFVKSWFDPKDLDGIEAGGRLEPYLEIVQTEFGSDAVGCVVRRLTSLPITRAPALALLGQLDDALAALSAGDATDLMALPTSLRLALEDRLRGDDLPGAAIKVRIDLHRAALEEVGDVPTPASEAWVTRAERLLGEDPQDDQLHVLLIRWLSQSWRFDEAEAALVAFAESAGDQGSVVSSRTYLADGYHSAARLDRAVHLLEQILAYMVRVLGPDHPDTLRSRSNLAFASEAAGDLAGAIPLLEQTLADMVRVLGPDHPDTLTSRNNLANAYREAGDLARAVPLLEQTLTDRLRVLGPD
ncbi:MAG: tetratricopeptide repeat protein, partial [Microlunatus sp.]